jgi:peptidoglycan/xylan/chitin deacetylase (PgdA/CDA1 family)
MKEPMTTQKAKVLMYHGIVDSLCPLPADRETGAELYDLPAGEFAKQMAHLKEHGYRVVRAEDAKDEKDVVITFDDGELNNFKIAMPILKRYNFPAYFFVIAGRVGKQGYMDWKQIRELHDAGMIVGSHGLSHQILTDLRETQIEEELRASKRTIELNINITVETISIPRGFCNDSLVEQAHESGYKTVFISDRPADLKADCLSRIAIKDHWTIERFDRALKGLVTPTESFYLKIKKAVKVIFRESGYNRLRSFLIKFTK